MAIEQNEVQAKTFSRNSAINSNLNMSKIVPDKSPYIIREYRHLLTLCPNHTGFPVSRNPIVAKKI